MMNELAGEHGRRRVAMKLEDVHIIIVAVGCYLTELRKEAREVPERMADVRSLLQLERRLGRIDWGNVELLLTVNEGELLYQALTCFCVLLCQQFQTQERDEVLQRVDEVRYRLSMFRPEFRVDIG